MYLGGGQGHHQLLEVTPRQAAESRGKLVSHVLDIEFLLLNLLVEVLKWKKTAIIQHSEVFIVKFLQFQELLLNFGLESKKLCDEFY